MKDGWGPLCKILDLPIPEEPFPRANDKVQGQEALKTLIKLAAIRWLGVFTVVGITVLAGRYVWNRKV